MTVYLVSMFPASKGRSQPLRCGLDFNCVNTRDQSFQLPNNLIVTQVRIAPLISTTHWRTLAKHF